MVAFVGGVIGLTHEVSVEAVCDDLPVGIERRFGPIESGAAYTAALPRGRC